MNSFKSLFKRVSPPLSASQSAKFAPSPDSPQYAFGFQSPYKQPRILILVDNVRATYFLSFHYALKRLHEQESLAFFVIESAEIKKWTKSRSPEAFVQQVIQDTQPTLVIFSRYGVPHGDVFPRLFKAQNIATVCHIDDDLLTIKPELGTEIQNRQGDPVVLRARRILLEETDLIYTSTAFLGDRFASQFPNQKVFYGTYPPYLDFLIKDPAPTKTQPLTIGYMGSKGHQIDLDAIAPQLQQTLAAHPTLRFETFGTIQMPEALTQFKSRIRAHKTNTDYAGFLNQLNALNWDIGLIPLQNTIFNRCRSATKFVEYTTCHIPVVASSGYVYDQFLQNSAPQILLAEGDEWIARIDQLIDKSNLRQTLVENAQAYCEQNFSLDALEAQIKEMLALV